MDKITLLGTKGGPAIYPVSPLRMPTSSLLEFAGQKIVIDCGLGVSRNLVASGFDLKSVRTIIITHLHSDHYLELGPLIHTAWTAGLSEKITIYGPDGLAEYWQHFLRAMSFDINLRIDDEGRVDLASLVEIKPLSGDQIDLGAVSVHATLNNHPPIEQSFALRFSDGQKSVVFSGDTAPFEGFDEFAYGADLLIHEAMIGEGVDRLADRVGNGARLKEHLYASHSEAVDVGALAQRCKIAQLALNHLVPVDDPAITDETWINAVRKSGYSGALHIGRDGMVIEF